MGYLKDISSSRELLYNLTMREVRGKYKRTALGQLWSLANPLAAMLVYTFVFSFIFRIQPAPGDPSGIDVFAIWLLCGLLPWIFFTNVVTAGTGSLVANAGLIQKVYFSRAVLPLSLVLAAAYNWLFEMAVLLIVLLIAGSFIWPWLPLVVVVMALLVIFAAGIAMMLSVANVYFRDTEHLLTILIQIWFYLTPIIYPMRLVVDLSNRAGDLWGTGITLLDIYRINPLQSFIAVFRELLYDNRWPDPVDFGACVAWALFSISLGLIVFKRNEKGLAEAL